MRVACVTIRPPGSPSVQYANQQRDLDSANDAFEQGCGLWIYCSGSQVVTTGILGTNGMLDQRDCNAGWVLDFIGIGDHEVSNEEDQLFSLGRDLGADIVGYFLPQGSTNPNLGGCAAHPGGRRGFWVAFGASQWMFAHELGHIVGDLGHRGSTDNLMFNTPGSITATPPEIKDDQCLHPFGGVLRDRDVEEC